MNAITWLEFELLYFDSVVQYFNHYATDIQALYDGLIITSNRIVDRYIDMLTPSENRENNHKDFSYFLIKEFFFSVTESVEIQSISKNDFMILNSPSVQSIIKIFPWKSS